MKRFFFTLLIVAMGTEAVAQGQMSVGVFDDERYIFGDFALRYDTSFVSLGLGMFGTVGRSHETYASLGFGSAAGRLEVGFPVPAYDRFADGQLLRFHPAFGLKTVGISRSRATQGAMTQTKYLPYGATFVTPGWAVSVHGVPDYATTIYGASGQWRVGDIVISAATELVGVAGVFDANAKIAMHFDQVTASYFRPHANGLDDYWELAVDVPVSERLELHTAMLSTFAQNTANLGLSAHYEVNARSALDLGVIWQQGHRRAINMAFTQSF